MSFPSLPPLTKKLFDLPDYAQRENNICSMVNFFSEAKRLMDALRLDRIVEIGSESGLNTAVLLDYVKLRGKKLVTVDPASVPFSFSPSAEPSFTFYQETSAEFLQRNIPAEVFFMDGDHNYETVLADLKTLHETRKKSGIKLLFLHDVSWPWARQDIYYDPARVSHPHPYHAENRVSPYTEENAPSLSPANYMVSDCAGGAENGVLTAVEDFLSLHGAVWCFQRIPILYGIGILIALENVKEDEKRKLLPLVDELASHCELLSILELNRIENLCQYDSLRQKLKEAGNVWRNDQNYIKTVNEILPGLSAEIQTRKTEMEHLQQSLAEKEVSLYKEQTEGIKRTQEWNAYKSKLERKLHADALQLQTASYEKTFFLNKLEELKLSLQKEAGATAQYQTELESVRKDLTDREGTIQTLNATTAQYQTELDSVRKDLTDRENTIQTLNATTAQYQTELDSVRKDLTDREGTIQTLNATTAQYQAELDSVRKDLTDREGTIQTLNATTAQYQTELDSVRKDLTDRENTIQTLNATTAQYQTELDSVRKDLTDREGTIQTLNATTAQYQTELDSVRKDLTDRENTIQTLNATTAQYQTELDSVRKDLADRENTIQALTEKYQADLEAVRSDLADRENTIQALTEKYQTDLEAVRSDLADRESTIQTLNATTAQCKKELKSIRSNLLACESRILTLTATTAWYQAELKSVRNDLTDRESRIQALNATTAQYQTELKSVRSDLSDRESRIQNLNELKDRCAKELLAKGQEIQTLQADLQKHRQLCEEQQNRISMLQELDRQNRRLQCTLEQNLRRQKLELPAEKWRTESVFSKAVLPYRFRNWQKLRRIKKALTDGSVKLLSLDVFDTLLFRGVRSESERFYDVGKILHRHYPKITAKQFYDARSLAHYLAYRICPGKEGCKEPGMEDIFRIMVKILQLPEEVISDLKQVELEYEMKHLSLNRTVWKLVLLSQKQNIPVIATSDMYWGREALQKIFDVCLPDPGAVAKIYSSSDYGVSKAAGFLFERIAEEHKVDFSQIVHIGDNRQSDFDVPFVRYGLSAYWLPRSKCYTAFCNRRQKHEKKNLQERNIIHGV